MSPSRALPNISIRNKLILLIVSICSIILFLAICFLIANHGFSERRNLIHNITTTAHLLGEYCVVPVSFGDTAEAKNILSKVKAIPEIMEVAIYDSKGKLFSAVGKYPFDTRLSVKTPHDFYNSENGIIHFYHPINFQSQFYGTLHLLVTTKILKLELAKKVVVVLAMGLVLIILSYLLAANFQKIISQPILELAKVFERSSESSDFSQRITWAGKDEIGTLYKGYNDFMQQLELRARARLKAEEELKKSEERYRAVVEDQTELICRYKRDGTILFANSAFCKFFDMTEAGITKRNILQFMPENINLNQFISGNNPKKDMLNVDCEMANNNGRKKKWHHWSHRKIYDDSSQLMEFQAIGIDITERVQAEKEAKIKQEQLIQAGKMVTLGTLVSGVAHEINNPNGYIMLNSSLLVNYCEKLKEYSKKVSNQQEELQELGAYAENFGNLAEKIKEGSDRINAIVKKLKNYYKKDITGDKKRVNINEVVEKAIEILDTKIKSSTSNFNFYHTSSLPQVWANFQELEQVVINLLENSCQALSTPSDILQISTGINPEGMVYVEVVDGGSGIDKEHIDRITDPFFTTKRNTGGTGLGLSLSLNIIADHNGHLFFDSNQGKGTKATILLPVANS